MITMSLPRFFIYSLRGSIKHKNLRKTFHPALLELYKHGSTQPVGATELITQERVEMTRPVVQKWKRPPFVKGLFMGKYDTMLLAFPEVLNRENLKEVEKCVQRINEIYLNKVNSLQIDEEAKIPKDVLEELKSLGLFGRLIPLEYGGLNLTLTEYTRLNEAVGLDWSIGAVLGAHDTLAAQALLIAGNEAQKRKYLPDLASGKKIATVCFYEYKGESDPTLIETLAFPVENESSYMLSGVKTWVPSAEIADLYIVFAKQNTSNANIEIQENLTVFIVERDMKGVKVSKLPGNTCLRGTGAGVLQFNEVSVPSENVLGVPGQGLILLNKLHEMARLGVGSLTIGALKTLLDRVTEYIIDAEWNQESLADQAFVREKLSKVGQMLYAMESLSYFTAAYYDTSENPDYALESAILKVFVSEGTQFCLKCLKELMGTLSFYKAQHLERFLRDAEGLARFEGSNDIARLLIGLTGCQHVGAQRATMVEKYRNPFFFPWEAVNLKYKYHRIQKGKFSYKQDIGGQLHPTLVAFGNDLEECVQRLEVATDRLLIMHGSNVVKAQLGIMRLADLAIDVCVMGAVLSRASRSYCIGMKNSEHEIRLAGCLSNERKEKFMQNFSKLMSGPISSEDEINIIMGGQIIDCRGYFPEHPLKYNY